MDKLTIEQKAQRYDEVIEKARKEYKNHESFKGFCEMLVHIFPELKESESEKTKRLLHTIANKMGQHLCDIFTEEEFQCFDAWSNAWLEKQGKKKSLDDVANEVTKDKDATVSFLKAAGIINEKGELADEYKIEQNEPVDIPVDAVLDGNKDGLIVDTIRCKKEIQSDKAEPKFKVGDWVMLDRPVLITKVEDMPYNTHQYWTSDGTWFGDATKAKLWTIQDAKDGDVLNSMRVQATIIFKGFADDGKHILAYCALQKGIFIKEEMLWDRDFKPSPKNWNDELFSKMKEAGYEWDADKKELKKIEQNPVQKTEPFEAEHGKYYYCIKDYFCGGKKQASKGDVVQALKGLPIMSLKDASEYFLPVNFIKCNSVWSEEDEENIDTISKALVRYISYDGITQGEERRLNRWLKSLKDRVQPQPKQELSEEDKEKINSICNIIADKRNIQRQGYRSYYSGLINWLKSLCPQSHWKPSDEQMASIKQAVSNMKNSACYDSELVHLLQDLEKLREE